MVSALIKRLYFCKRSRGQLSLLRKSKHFLWGGSKNTRQRSKKKALHRRAL